MIELNKKTQQDFLNREYAKKLLDAGVDMSDSRYMIIKKQSSIVIKEGEKPKTIKKDYVVERRIYTELMEDAIPTLTLSELIKLFPERTMLCTGISDNEEDIFFVSSACFDIDTDEYTDPIDACFEMVILLLENSYIKK